MKKVFVKGVKVGGFKRVQKYLLRKSRGQFPAVRREVNVSTFLHIAEETVTIKFLLQLPNS